MRIDRTITELDGMRQYIKDKKTIHVNVKLTLNNIIDDLQNTLNELAFMQKENQKET